MLESKNALQYLDDAGYNERQCLDIWDNQHQYLDVEHYNAGTAVYMFNYVGNKQRQYLKVELGCCFLKTNAAPYKLFAFDLKTGYTKM